MIEVTSSGKETVVKIRIEDWCKLTDALHVPPESPIEYVIEKIELLKKLKLEQSKKLYDIQGILNRAK